MVICLSNKHDYEGGALHLVDKRIKHRFNKGDAILFDSNILHGVEEVTGGLRQVLISFLWDDMGETQRRKAHPTKSVTPYLPNMKCNDHDIDYSNIRVTNEWSDKDAHLYENNNSDTLIISFAGLGCKNTAPTFIFYNFLKRYNNIDKLFLRDIKCQYYLTGLKHNTNTITDTVTFIQNIIKGRNYKKVFAIGCSAGAFAAILYGHLLKIDKVIAFAPQTVLNEYKTNVMKDNTYAPHTCRYLTRYNKDPFYQKCLDLKSFIPFNTKVDIHYPKRASNGLDTKHAEYIKHSKCNLYGYDSNNHRIALELRDKGILAKLIETELQ
jgi:hypothetical protein